MLRRALLAPFALAVTGCYWRGAPRATPTKVVSSRAAIIVGRVELAPALRPEDQKLDRHSWARGDVFLLYSSKKRSDASPDFLDLASAIHAPHGRTFAALVPRKHLFVSQARVLLEYRNRPRAAKWLMLKGGEIEILPSDEAAYIGTLRFHWAWASQVPTPSSSPAEVIDDYEAEKRAFEAQFAVPLRKSLFRPSVPRDPP